MPRRRHALLIAVGVLALAACGGASLGPVAQAARATAKAGPSRMLLLMTVSVGKNSATVRGRGVVDPRSNASNIVFDIALPNAGKPAHLQEITDGTIAYLRVPESVRKSVSGTKHWVEVDLARPGGAGAAASPTSHVDPVQILQYLQKSANVVKLGVGKVRGVASQEYSVTIDLEQAAQGKLGTGLIQQNAKAFEQQLGTNVMAADVWVGADGYVRRIQLFLQPATGNAATTRALIDFFDFNKQTAVKVPPASDVKKAA